MLLLRLPCFVDELEGFVLLWKRGETILSVGKQVIDPQETRCVVTNYLLCAGVMVQFWKPGALEQNYLLYDGVRVKNWIFWDKGLYLNKSNVEGFCFLYDLIGGFRPTIMNYQGSARVFSSLVYNNLFIVQWTILMKCCTCYFTILNHIIKKSWCPLKLGLVYGEL